jgi:argininosuccinate lyase
MRDNHNNDNYQLWGGRFDCPNDKLMKIFNDSLPIDKRLWREDIIVTVDKKEF